MIGAFDEVGAVDRVSTLQRSLLQPWIDPGRDLVPERRVDAGQRADLDRRQVETALLELAKGAMRVAQKAFSKCLVGEEPADNCFNAALRHAA